MLSKTLRFSLLFCIEIYHHLSSVIHPGHYFTRDGFSFYESELIKICEKCFKGFNETYLFYEDIIDVFHYITHCNIYLNICKYVYLLSCFCLKKKVLT